MSAKKLFDDAVFFKTFEKFLKNKPFLNQKHSSIRHRGHSSWCFLRKDYAYKLGLAFATQHTSYVIIAFDGKQPKLFQFFLQGLIDAGAIVENAQKSDFLNFFDYVLSRNRVGIYLESETFCFYDCDGKGFTFSDIDHGCAQDEFIGRNTVVNIEQEYFRRKFPEFQHIRQKKTIIMSGDLSISQYIEQFDRACNFNFHYMDCQSPDNIHIQNLIAEVLSLRADFAVFIKKSGQGAVFIDDLGRPVLPEHIGMLILNHMNTSHMTVAIQNTISKVFEHFCWSKKIRVKRVIMPDHYAKNFTLTTDGFFSFPHMRCADGLYTALKIIDIVNAHSIPLSFLLKELPSVFMTDEIFLPLNKKEQKQFVSLADSLGIAWISRRQDGLAIRLESKSWLNLFKFRETFRSSLPEELRKHI